MVMINHGLAKVMYFGRREVQKYPNSKRIFKWFTNNGWIIDKKGSDRNRIKLILNK